MLLLSIIVWLWVTQTVSSFVLSDDHGSSTIETNSSNRTFPRRRFGADFQGPRERRDDGQEHPKSYVADAEKPDDDAGTEAAQKFIEQKLKDTGRDPKFIIVMRDPRNRTQILGWGGLRIDDTIAKELVEHPAIRSVVPDVPAKKRRSLKRNLDAPLKKRALDWNRLEWKKTEESEDTLIIVSQYQGIAFDDLDAYVYESHRGQSGNGQGVYIYVLDEGIQMDVKLLNNEEFPHRETTIYTDNCIVEQKNSETDEDVKSHGTKIASLALGQFHGVAKGATLVSVKYCGELADAIDALEKARQDISAKNRQMNSVVVFPVGDPPATDKNVVITTSAKALEAYWSIHRILEMGVPVVTPAGNDRRDRRDTIDFWPSYWEDRTQYPLINVAETDNFGFRSETSQAGDQVTTWAPSWGAHVMTRDGNTEEDAGTSMGCGIVAGVIAHVMAFDETPWGPARGIQRAISIRDFINRDERSGWRRDDKDDHKGERVIWNGATKEAHERAIDDPDMPDYEGITPGHVEPGNELDPGRDESPAPQPARGDPKSLQIVYREFMVLGHPDPIYHWNFFEGNPGEGVDPCGKPLATDKAPERPGQYEPPRIQGEWNLRFEGYAEDCIFKGIGRKGEEGDVGWLRCPERPDIKCIENMKITEGEDGWTPCRNPPVLAEARIPVAYCDWE